MCDGRFPISLPAQCLHRSGRPGFPGAIGCIQRPRSHRGFLRTRNRARLRAPFPAPSALRLRLVPSLGLPPSWASPPPSAASASSPFGPVPSAADNHVNTSATGTQHLSREMALNDRETERKTPPGARIGPKSRPRAPPCTSDGYWHAPVAPPFGEYTGALAVRRPLRCRGCGLLRAASDHLRRRTPPGGGADSQT